MDTAGPIRYHIGTVSPPNPEITRLLLEFDPRLTAAPRLQERLMELVYAELRATARGLMSRERVEHTLQPTALVHEAWLKIVNQDRVQWQDRARFLGIAARQVLQAAIDGYVADYEPGHPQMGATQVDLAEVLLREGDKAGARGLLQEAVPVLENVYGADFELSRRARRLLARTKWTPPASRGRSCPPTRVNMPPMSTVMASVARQIALPPTSAARQDQKGRAPP